MSGHRRGAYHAPKPILDEDGFDKDDTPPPITFHREYKSARGFVVMRRGGRKVAAAPLSFVAHCAQSKMPLAADANLVRIVDAYKTGNFSD